MSAIVLDEINAAPPSYFATEEDFEAWCDEDTKADYVDGRVIVDGPQLMLHAGAGTCLGTLLELFAGKHDFGVVIATQKVQVRLRSGLRRSPDIVFISKMRAHIMREYFIDGAPDLVVELVSSESTIRDWHEKYIEYEAAGIPEYWLIDQPQQRATLYALGDDRRYHPILPKEGKYYSKILPGFWVKMEWFWPDSQFNTYEMAKEMGILA